MAIVVENSDYESLAARMDAFIFQKLDHGCFRPSVIGTELIYHAIDLAFPDEPDAFATFSDRIAAHFVRVVEDPHTGADLLVGVRIKPEYAPLHTLRASAFSKSLVR